MWIHSILAAWLLFASPFVPQYLQSAYTPTAGGGVTFSLIQHPFNTCASGVTSCTITMTQATGSGNFLVVWFESGGGTLTLISGISAGGTFVHCTNCSIKDTPGDVVDMGYVLSSTSGVSSIAVSLNHVIGGSGNWTVGINEYHRSSGTWTLDTSGSAADNTNCTACAGVTLIGGANDVVVQLSSPANTVGSITPSSPWNNPADITNSVAGALGVAASTAITWNQSPTGTMAVAAEAGK